MVKVYQQKCYTMTAVQNPTSLMLFKVRKKIIVKFDSKNLKREIGHRFLQTLNTTTPTTTTTIDSQSLV